MDNPNDGYGAIFVGDERNRRSAAETRVASTAIYQQRLRNLSGGLVCNRGRNVSVR